MMNLLLIVVVFGILSVLIPSCKGWGCNNGVGQRCCSRPATISNGVISPKGLTSARLGEELTIQCNAEFTPSDLQRSVCQANGSWNPSIPTCKGLKECRAPNKPPNGFFRPPFMKRYSPGTTIWFGCISGYVISGQSNSTCISNKQWSHPLPTCKATCPVPTILANGSYLPVMQTYTSGTTIHFSCNSGYIINGPSSLRCQTTRQWSSSFPTCRATCPVPTILAKGSFRPVLRTYTSGTTIVFSCNSGYTISGPSSLRCLTTRRWSSSYPTCRATCPVPTRLANGSFRPVLRTYTSGTSISFGCYSGYVISGQSSLRCLTNRRWSSSFPTCRRRSCNPPPRYVHHGHSNVHIGHSNVHIGHSNVHIGHSNIHPVKRSYRINEPVIYWCDSDHTPIGSSRTRCLNGERWLPSNFRCAYKKK